MFCAAYHQWQLAVSKSIPFVIFLSESTKYICIRNMYIIFRVKQKIESFFSHLILKHCNCWLIYMNVNLRMKVVSRQKLLYSLIKEEFYIRWRFDRLEDRSTFINANYINSAQLYVYIFFHFLLFFS